jgi:rRNA maturation RNase YbeY
LNQNIHFHFEDLSFQLSKKKALRIWLNECAKAENQTIDQLNYIFCSDNYLLEINKKYLNHDFYTDVISFDYSENGLVSGDIYISYPRVKENAGDFLIPIKEELQRVIIHGLLHLLGYSDKTPSQKKTMKSKEDFYLSLRAF